MRRGMRKNVGENSQAAVAVAGNRERRVPVKSQGAWSEIRGNRPEAAFRPGKTAHERRRP